MNEHLHQKVGGAQGAGGWGVGGQLWVSRLEVVFADPDRFFCKQ